MSSFLDECRSALRYLRRRPLFAVAVSATLAAAIAVATTAYGVARSVLWRTLPFDDAAQLVFVWEDTERDGHRQASRVTGARYAAWRDASQGVASLALFGATGFTLEGPNGATSVRGVRVSANYFDTLGIRPARGRTFVPDDERPGNDRVVVLSDGFWRQRLGAREDVIGEFLRLGGQAYQVVGVMPPVAFPAWPLNPASVTIDADSRELWVPIPRTAALDQSARAHVFGVIGRLAPGINQEHVAERFTATATPATPDPHGARVEPLRGQFVHDARAPLLALTAAALVVLLIACANVASLYVSAFESRSAELAIRAAVGAGVPRLVRQLALEALMLAAVGALGGIATARVALAAVPGALPPSVPLLTPPTLDVHVGAIALALAVFAAIAFTAWPVARLIRTGPMPRGAAARARGNVYRGLVVSQIALTMGLAPAAGLLAQSLQSVRSQHPGFTIDRVLVADVTLPAATPSFPTDLAVAEEQLLAAVAARPYVRGVAAAYDHPLEANWSENPTVLGAGTIADDQRQAELRIVSPGYFETMEVRVIDGRTLTARDTFTAPGVAVVNEAFAREMEGRVLGRRLRTGTPRFLYGNAAPGEFEIVGIVNNERFRGLERPAQPAFYLSTRQFPQTGFALLVRTDTEPAAAAADLRSTVRAVNDRITFDGVTPLTAVLAEQLVSRAVTTAVIGAFAVASLALAALGIYGLLAVMVGSRTHEIAVRLAIGASPASVARAVLRDSLRTAAIGIVLGAGLAVLAGRLIRHLLVGIGPGDPATLGMAVTTLLAIAAGAALVPAVRGARVDPVTILRAER